MDTLRDEDAELLPVTCFIVTGIHGTELESGITVEVVLLVVDEVDDLLTVSDRIEEHLVGGAALHDGNYDLGLGGDDTGLQDELSLIIGSGDVSERLDVLAGEFLGGEDGIDDGDFELFDILAARFFQHGHSDGVILVDDLAFEFEGIGQHESLLAVKRWYLVLKAR